MPSDGLLLVVDPVIPRDNSAHFGKLLDLEMLVLTPRGRERTRVEFEELLKRSGFRLCRVVPTNRKFRLRPLGHLLCADSPQALGAYARFVAHDSIWRPWGELRYSVKPSAWCAAGRLMGKVIERLGGFAHWRGDLERGRHRYWEPSTYRANVRANMMTWIFEGSSTKQLESGSRWR
jgi:O-methyltransferase domain